MFLSWPKRVRWNRLARASGAPTPPLLAHASTRAPERGTARESESEGETVAKTEKQTDANTHTHTHTHTQREARTETGGGGVRSLLAGIHRKCRTNCRLDRGPSAGRNGEVCKVHESSSLQPQLTCCLGPEPLLRAPLPAKPTHHARVHTERHIAGPQNRWLAGQAKNKDRERHLGQAAMTVL